MRSINRSEYRQLPTNNFAQKTAAVSDRRVGAVLATRNVAAKSHGAAALDGRHHFQLTKADVTGVGATPGGAVVAEDIRDLEL
jgi:hypothetical protein